MKTRRILSSLVVVAMMVSLFTAVPTFATGTTGEIGMTLSKTAPVIGDIVTATVYVKSIPTIASIQVTLGYNPAVVKLWNKTTDVAATSAANGINATSFLALADPDDTIAFETASIGNVVDVTKGLIDWNCSTALSDVNGYYAYTVPDPATNLTVMTLRFKVVGAGNANLCIAKQASGGNYTVSNPLGYLIKAVVGQPNITGLTEAIATFTVVPALTNITSVTNPDAKNVAYNTAFADLALPATVVVTDGTKSPSIGVTWTASDYSATSTAAAQTINGTLSTADLTTNSLTNTSALQPTISVTVSAAPLSTDANLSALSVTGATLNETFAANSLNYTATVANGVDSVTINATKADSKATVAGDGVQALAVGPNIFNVVVTAENTSVVKTYVVNITRQTPPVVGAVVKAGDVSGYIGQNVIVPVTITGMTALNDYAARISYETSKLEYVSVSKGANITEDGVLDLSMTGEIGISGLTVANGVAGLVGDVVVANVTFKVIAASADTSTVTVSAGRYNGITVAGTNLTNGTVTYTLSTDPLLTTATQKVEAYEAVVATTIAQIDLALATEKVAAENAVALVVATESQAAKALLATRITNKTTALNNEKTALQAEDAAKALVVAYEVAPITTLTEVETAEGKATTAYSAVNALRAGSVKTDLLARLNTQDGIVATTKAALTKAAALAAINAGTATITEYQLVAPLATSDLLDNYKRGVAAQSSALTESQVIALVSQVNNPVAPVISDVVIVGQAVTGAVLSVNYTYYDANYDLENVANTVIVWTVTGGNPATQATYTVATADVTNTITVTVAGVSSSASLPVILRGDVDANGSVNEHDAFFIRQVYNATFTGTVLIDTVYTDTAAAIAQKVEAADYDKSGATNSLDVSDVLKLAAETI